MPGQLLRRRPHRPVVPLPVQPPDRSWDNRAAALRVEKPANTAMTGALLAVLTAFIGWTVVLVPHGDVRGNPLFWLLAIPLLCWTTPLLQFRAWAVNLVWLVLLLAPLLSLAALLTAGHAKDAYPLTSDPARLATPGAMLMVFGVTMAFSIGGVAALRRSSLPGGTRPASYLAPSTLPVGSRTPLPAAYGRALRVGSLALSGVLVNGILFAIATTLDMEGQTGGLIGSAWPAVIPVLLATTTGTLILRGKLALTRRPGAVPRTFRWGLAVGAASTSLLLGLLWVWPLPAGARNAFSIMMAPMAAAAAWGAWHALRKLPCIRM